MSKATDKLLNEAKEIVAGNPSDEIQLLIENLEDLGAEATGSSTEYRDLKAALANLSDIPAEDPLADVNDSDVHEDPEAAKKAIDEAKVNAETPLEDGGPVKVDNEGAPLPSPETPKVSDKKVVKFKKLIKNPVSIGFETYTDEVFELTAAEVKQNENQIKRSIELKMIERV